MTSEGLKVATTLAGLVVMFLLGEIGSAAWRRWREWNGEDTTYDADEQAARLLLGRQLFVGLLAAIAAAVLLVSAFKSPEASGRDDGAGANAPRSPPVRAAPQVAG